MNVRPRTLWIILFLIVFVFLLFYNLYHVEEHVYETEGKEPHQEQLPDV